MWLKTFCMWYAFYMKLHNLVPVFESRLYNMVQVKETNLCWNKIQAAIQWCLLLLMKSAFILLTFSEIELDNSVIHEYSRKYFRLKKVLFSARVKDLFRELIVGNYRIQMGEHERHSAEPLNDHCIVQGDSLGTLYVFEHLKENQTYWHAVTCTQIFGMLEHTQEAHFLNKITVISWSLCCQLCKYDCWALLIALFSNVGYSREWAKLQSSQLFLQYICFCTHSRRRSIDISYAKAF